jgi:hypothetical protein
MVEKRRRDRKSIGRFSLGMVASATLITSGTLTLASLPCSSDDLCENMIRKGSYCLQPEGVCSNPFQQGCLQTLLPERNFGKRTCNSDDPPDAVDKVCLESDFQYPEIRIHNGDWESSIFLAWIMQILLMEILEVPVTIGLGQNTQKESFYGPDNSFPYSTTSYPFDALKTANEVKDCRMTQEDCAHVMVEVWNSQLRDWNKVSLANQFSANYYCIHFRYFG